MKEQPTRRVTGWLTNSRCIADEVENFQCEHRTQSKHHCQDELVLAIIKGLREKLQVDGNIDVCSIGPRFTGHDDEPTDEEENKNFFDHLGQSSTPRRNQKFLNVQGSPRRERKRQGTRLSPVV